MLGTIVREHREEAGLSIDDLAEQANVGTATVSRLELGYSKTTLESIERIAGVLKTTAAELLTETEERERQVAVSAKRESRKRKPKNK